MVHGVQNLIGREANVDGVQHRSDHRDGEHTLQVAVAVPVHHRHGITGLDPGLSQYVGQSSNPLIEGGIAVAHLVAVNDFTTFLITDAGQQQALDQQRSLMSIRGGGNQTGLQHGGTLIHEFYQ